MSQIGITIDGNAMKGQAGMTILEAAMKVAIDIPTLCFVPGLCVSGNCRVCVVEVEGYRTLVGSCHTPLTEGMVILTGSPKVLKARKTTIELLMAGHTGECVTDPSTNKCELRKLADLMEGGTPRFPMRRPRWYPIEETNPYVKRDMSKCILCRKCIFACKEIAKKNLYAVAYRGFASKVIVGFDESLTTGLCKDCSICIEHCPTGALMESTQRSKVE